MEKEKIISPAISGYLGLLLILVLIGGPILGIILLEQYWMVIFELFGLIGFGGFLVVNPNESAVLILFGKYKGTIKSNGFFWLNPFFVKKKISLRARNIDGEPLKVNDKLGNPIMIGVVMVWQVENTFKAAFDVDDYIKFVKIQSESAMRKLAHMYPYDNFDDDEKDLSLRSGGDEINHMLEEELRERLQLAGIKVLEARISNLSYAPEIAHAMLQRQQATAVIAARMKIVEGAVSMVENALLKLSERKIVDLDDEKKAAMVSNLMVVLCSDRSASPVINAGTLNH
jgi:regulator of protease activity HflC (stomatin/prohibitin superfamily)